MTLSCETSKANVQHTKQRECKQRKEREINFYNVNFFFSFQKSEEKKKSITKEQTRCIFGLCLGAHLVREKTHIQG